MTDATDTTVEPVVDLLTWALAYYRQWRVGIWADADELERERPDVPKAVIRMVRDLIATDESGS